MIEYIATLSGVESERPIQSISYSLKSISDWIEKTLVRHPSGTVQLYEHEKKLLGVFRGPRARLECTCGHDKSAHINITSIDPSRPLGACAKLECRCKQFEERK